MQILPIYQSSVARWNPRSYMAFSCHVSFISFTLKQFLDFFVVWSFITPIFLKRMSQLFCRMLFDLDLSDVLSWLDSNSTYIFGGNTTKVVMCCFLKVSFQEIQDVNFIDKVLWNKYQLNSAVYSGIQLVYVMV